MLGTIFAHAGLFSRHARQSARSRARTRVGFDLDILESRDLMSGFDHTFEHARAIAFENKVKNLKIEVSGATLKSELRVMKLAELHMNSGKITIYSTGGPSTPAIQTPPTKIIVDPIGISGAPSSTTVNNPLPVVTYTLPSSPISMLTQTPSSSTPKLPGSPGSNPATTLNGGLPVTGAPQAPAPAAPVPIDVITPGPGPVFY